MQKWRQGRHYPIHIYEGVRPVATFFSADDARLACEALDSYAATHSYSALLEQEAAAYQAKINGARELWIKAAEEVRTLCTCTGDEPGLRHSCSACLL